VEFQKISKLPPRKGVSLRPIILLEIPIKLHKFLYIFWSYIYFPYPQGIPIPSVGGVWIFSGTAHFEILLLS